METSGILPETSPLNGINGHSDKLHIPSGCIGNPDTLEITTTRTDPAVFLEPYTTQDVLQAASGLENHGIRV